MSGHPPSRISQLTGRQTSLPEVALANLSAQSEDDHRTPTVAVQPYGLLIVPRDVHRPSLHAVCKAGREEGVGNMRGLRRSAGEGQQQMFTPETSPLCQLTLPATFPDGARSASCCLSCEREVGSRPRSSSPPQTGGLGFTNRQWRPSRRTASRERTLLGDNATFLAHLEMSRACAFSQKQPSARVMLQ